MTKNQMQQNQEQVRVAKAVPKQVPSLQNQSIMLKVMMMMNGLH
jgi:hypothetical protein